MHAHNHNLFLRRLRDRDFEERLEEHMWSLDRDAQDIFYLDRLFRFASNDDDDDGEGDNSSSSSLSSSLWSIEYMDDNDDWFRDLAHWNVLTRRPQIREFMDRFDKYLVSSDHDCEDVFHLRRLFEVDIVDDDDDDNGIWHYFLGTRVYVVTIFAGVVIFYARRYFHSRK